MGVRRMEAYGFRGTLAGHAVGDFSTPTGDRLIAEFDTVPWFPLERGVSFLSVGYLFCK